MKQQAGSPLFLITGLVIGIILGMVYGWVITPTESFETHPQSLQWSYKNTYREMIAVAYLASGDLGRAKARLDLLGDDDLIRELQVQAQRTSEEGSLNIARALGVLKSHLEEGPDSVPLNEPDYTQEPPGSASPDSTEPGVTGLPEETATVSGTQEPTSTSSPDLSAVSTITNTPESTSIPTATQGAPFALLDFDFNCDNPNNSAPLIQVFIKDAAGRQVPGVQVIVIWDGGENSFYTGFKPEFGLGYADFEMTPGVSYDLTLVESDDPVKDLLARECEEGEERYWANWVLNYKQP